MAQGERPSRESCAGLHDILGAIAGLHERFNQLEVRLQVEQDKHEERLDALNEYLIQDEVYPGLYRPPDPTTCGLPRPEEDQTGPGRCRPAAASRQAHDGAL